MTAPTWLGATGFTQLQVAAIQASCTGFVDASEGSVTLAYVQGVNGAALWLQGEVADTLTLTRAATSNGLDLDSWMADWFFTRLPAIPSAGPVTFSSFTPTTQRIIPAGNAPGGAAPLGGVISTGPGGTQFYVTVDTTNAAYSAVAQGYVMAPSVASVTVPVQAVIAGTGGNVLANTITSFVQPISGVDTVTNAAGFTTGMAAEVDAAFRARFALYLASLRRATDNALQYAVESIQQGTVAVILPNETYAGTTQYGFVTVVVDNGTGTPPSSLITAASAAILNTIAASVNYGVFAPTVVTVTVACTVVSTNTSLHGADITAATAAVQNYINTLPIGASLIRVRLFQVIFDSSSNINDVTILYVNSGTSDITASAVTVIKCGSCVVS